MNIEPTQILLKRAEDEKKRLTELNPDLNPLQYGYSCAQIGETLIEIARRIPWNQNPEEKRETLREAMNAFHNSIPYLEHDRKALGRVWNSLGLVFAGLSRMTGGAQTREYCKKAVNAYENALNVRSMRDDPQGFSETQNNMGVCLAEAARRRYGNERLAMLERAVEAHQISLESRTGWDRDDYALSHHHLANALWELASAIEDHEEKMDMLRDACRAYRHSLRVYSADYQPFLYALVRNNLGNALSDLAEFTEGEERRERYLEAIESYREALKIRTPEETPEDYAMTQNNFGATLSELSRHVAEEERPAMLREVIGAYHEALKFYTTEKRPDDFAATQNNLGNAMADLADCLTGEERMHMLKDALTAYEKAMEIRAHSESPELFAQTALNQAVAVSQWPDLEEGLMVAALKALNDLDKAKRLSPESPIWHSERAAAVRAMLERKAGDLLRGDA